MVGTTIAMVALFFITKDAIRAWKAGIRYDTGDYVLAITGIAAVYIAWLILFVMIVSVAP